MPVCVCVYVYVCDCVCVWGGVAHVRVAYMSLLEDDKISKSIFFFKYM